jgi:STE24 endopeptidase
MANEDKATRYQRLQRRASVASTAVAALLLLGLLATGAAAALRARLEAWTGGSFVVEVAGFVLALALLNELMQLPIVFYAGVTLERRTGLSAQPTRRWWLDHAKATALTWLFAVGGALVVMWLLRRVPDYWWIAAAAIFTLVLVVAAQLAPVVLLPLFYDVRPLDRPALVPRLVALADRAGARVLGVFEWRMSDRTRKANAALTGIGVTRRILLSDTLLAAHSDDEIEVILAHELAHHVHRDIWSALGLEVALIAAGFYVADRVLTACTGWFGLTGKGDIAALPLLVLTAAAVSLALMPLANALSRSHERRADRYALELTRNAAAFVSAMKRLAAQNLAEDQPSPLVKILFHTHPSTTDRIAAAERWQRHRAASV